MTATPTDGVTVGASVIGPIALRWHTTGSAWVLDAILLPPMAAQCRPTGEHPQAQRLLRDLATGAPHWALAARATSACSAFALRIGRVLAERVPAGRVIGYADLARLAGRASGAARAVGAAMAANRWPLLVPCHRVVAADGALRGFQGGARDGLARKRRLLAAEGVAFAADARVAAEHVLRV